jgi:hypothetical protein
MPLKVTVGVPIKSPPGTAPPPPGAARVLNVPFIGQEQTNWCWAGCCQMVFRFFGLNDVSQCQMASREFGGDCCAAPSSSACNQPNYPESTYYNYGFTCTPQQGAFTLGSLQAELNAGRPVEVYYSWYGGGAHVAIVRGYYDNGDLEVNDPAYGPGRRAYSFVLGGYGLGTWTYTYSNLAR